uniref:Uncharacterized protein n=1 Tax=Ixodes ricinus TaxID=34613 RepID=A0A0K8R7J0_IXORI
MASLSNLCRFSCRTLVTRAAFNPKLKHGRQCWEQLRLTPLASMHRKLTSAASSQGHGSHENHTNSTLVYLGTIRSTVKMVKALSLTTSFVGILAQPILLQQLNGSSKIAIGIVTIFASFFIFVTPLLLHYITKRYVTELRFDSSNKQFSATTLSLLNRKRKFEFTAEDVKIPAVPGPFTTLLAKGRPLFVDIRDFHDVDVLKHLMGYDKPIDWHLSQPQEQSSAQKPPQEESPAARKGI